MPKITSLLNNNILNCALPIILESIYKLALQEAQSTLGPLTDNAVYQNYQGLKDIFASTYGIAPSQILTWSEFNRFLEKHDFVAKELMFIPILRCFIAEMAKINGYDSQKISRLSELPEDSQQFGRYYNLTYETVVKLLYQPLGIAVHLYHHQEKQAAISKYKLFHTMEPSSKAYPLGEIPVLNLFYKNAHYEIQDHDSLIGEIANEAYRQLNSLPPDLSSIYYGFLTTVNPHKTKAYLKRLVAYVQRSFNEQDELAKAEQALVEVEADFLKDTPEGRAASLLKLAALSNNQESRAKKLLDYLNNLAYLAKCDEPLAAYSLSKLSTAIDLSKGYLFAKKISDAVLEMERILAANVNMNFIEQAALYEQHRRLIPVARKTIREAWKEYKKTGNLLMIDVIQKTQAVAVTPTVENLKEYNILRRYLLANHKPSRAKLIAGLMLSVIGLALVVLAAFGWVATLGMSTPVSALVLTAGIASTIAGVGIFNAGRNKSIHKVMGKVLNEVESAKITL